MSSAICFDLDQSKIMSSGDGLKLNIINPLSDDKIVALAKLKAFADDNFIVTQTVQFLFERLQNVVGKGENASYQHFILFPHCFQFYQTEKSPFHQHLICHL